MKNKFKYCYYIAYSYAKGNVNGFGNLSLYRNKKMNSAVFYVETENKLNE